MDKADSADLQSLSHRNSGEIVRLQFKEFFKSHLTIGEMAQLEIARKKTKFLNRQFRNIIMRRSGHLPNFIGADFDRTGNILTNLALRFL